jgi:hypothetical protein
VASFSGDTALSLAGMNQVVECFDDDGYVVIPAS